MKESSITASILKWIDALPHGKALKIHGSAMGGKGHPDIIACILGRLVAIEVKQPGKRPTQLQAYVLEQWRKAGAIAISATTLDDVKDAVHDLRRQHALDAST